jgi:hypothetical protein
VRLGPPLRVDADHARAGAELADLVQERGLDVAARDEHELRVHPGSVRRVDQILALGDEQAGPLPVLSLLELANQLELFVVGAGDHRWQVRTKQRAARIC